MNQPDFLGIGTHKGGSSWIYQALFEHPEVYLLEKDLHFFSLERMWQKGIPWYESLYSSAQKTQQKGDSSITYFSSESAAQRIRETYPNVKLFACLRNPVHRLISHYSQDLKMGHISAEVSLEEVIKKDVNYIEFARYSKYLPVYLNLFPKEQIQILLFDDLEGNPGGFIRSLYKFLEVDDSFKPTLLEKRVNAAKMPRSFAVDRLIRNAGNRLKQSSRGRELWWKLRQSKWVNSVMKLNAAPPKSKVVSEADRIELRKHFTEDIAYVKEFLERPDLNW